MTDQAQMPAILAELAAAREAQARLQQEIESLRKSTTGNVINPVVHVRDESDLSDEVALLRSSLATLASELAAQKERADAAEKLQQEEQEKVAVLRSKAEESRRALMQLQSESSRRLSSSSDALPRSRLSISAGSMSGDAPLRRKSSLGLVPVNPLSGLGLGVDNGRSCPSPHGRSTNLARLAHRKSATNLGLPTIEQHSPAEDDRLNKLRDLRLGYTATKIGSRRGSTVAEGAFGPLEIEFDRRSSGHVFARHDSISEEGGEHEDFSPTRPPSAPLRMAGRKDSVPVFDAFYTRRDSALSSGSEDYSYTSSPRHIRRQSESSLLQSFNSQDDRARLQFELEGLRIQLAEAEEGRRASEACLRALKDYIASSTGAPDTSLKLPPLPTETGPAVELSPPIAEASPSRWTLPSFGSFARKSSTGSTTSSTSSQRGSLPTTVAAPPSRRLSNATMTSSDRPTPSTQTVPIFSSFSFSALVDRNTSFDDGETSPTMGSSQSMGSSASDFASAGHSREPSLSFTESSSSEADSASLDSRSATPEQEETEDDARRLSLYEDAIEPLGAGLSALGLHQEKKAEVPTAGVPRLATA